MKILIAYDGSPPAEAALDETLARPWPEGSEVRLVTVVERPLTPPPPDGAVYGPLVERMRSALREEAYQRIQKALQKFDARPDLESGYEIRDGNPKQGLLASIKEWEPDLVMAGSHGRAGLARLFLGSVSHTLVTHAPCSVEVVKGLPEAS